MTRLGIEPFLGAAREVGRDTIEAEVGFGVVMRIAVTDFKRPEAPARARFDFDFRDHVLTVLGRWGNRGLAPERPDPLAARCDNEHSPIFPLRHVFARALGFDGEVSDFGRDEKPPGLRDDALKYRREPLAEDMIFFRITGPQHGFIECCGNPMRLSCGFQSIHTGRTGSLFSDGTVVLPHLPNSRSGAVGHHALPHLDNIQPNGSGSDQSNGRDAHSTIFQTRPKRG